VKGVIAKEPLVKSNPECVNAVVSYFADSAATNISEDSKASKVICFGGFGSKFVSEIYNISDKTSMNYPEFPCSLSGGNVLKLDDFIYYVGGTVEEKLINTTNKVYRLNLKDLNSGWQEVASMSEKRIFFGAAVYNGCLVVTGGSNGFSRICTTELYQPS